MEFERRSKRGMVTERKEQEEAQRSSDAINEGVKARRVANEEKRESRKVEEPVASTSKSATEEVLHNLSAAQYFLSEGGVSADSSL